jgi:hypothetical protein
MITGRNTDVHYGTKVYHVQTEAGPASNPKIESRIYVDGEIIGSFVSSYEELVDALGLDRHEDEARARLGEQHQAIVEAIKSGKYDSDEGADSDQFEAASEPVDSIVHHTIMVTDIIGPDAVTIDSSEKLFDYVADILRSSESDHIVIDFAGMNSWSSGWIKSFVCNLQHTFGVNGSRRLYVRQTGVTRDSTPVRVDDM